MDELGLGRVIGGWLEGGGRGGGLCRVTAMNKKG